MKKMKFDIQMFGGRGASSGNTQGYNASEYRLYVRAKERPESITPMEENSTDWEALEEKYASRYEKESKKQTSKGKYTVEYFKSRGTEVLNSAPKGYIKLEGATTAPNGYSWYSNGKSRFGGEYKSVLVKDKKRRK